MGFISTKAHTVIGLLVGVLLIFSSTLFGFTDNTAASMVPLIVGIFIVLNELITTSPFSPLKLVPMKAHIVIDVLTGVFLIVSPFLFQFMDTEQPNQWVPHIVVGVLVVGYALLTNTRDDRAKSIAE